MHRVHPGQVLDFLALLSPGSKFFVGRHRYLELELEHAALYRSLALPWDWHPISNHPFTFERKSTVVFLTTLRWDR